MRFVAQTKTTCPSDADCSVEQAPLGCKTRKEYEDKKAKRRGFKNNRELLDHLAAKKGFKSYNEYWKKLTKGKNRKDGEGKVSRLEKQLENNMYINKKQNTLELLDILYDAHGKGCGF